MTSFNNVSEYVSTLNLLEPVAAQSGTDDLSVFANTEFFDFDMGRATDANERQISQKQPQTANPNSQQQYQLLGEYQNRQDDIQPQQQQQPNGSSSYQHPELGENEHAELFDSILNQNIPNIAYPQYDSSSIRNVTSIPTSDDHRLSTSSLPETPNTSSSGSRKRKSDGTPQDEGSRVAAEEDKRRRNTAASARFRIKKKMREQAMERSAKELQDKVQQLETQVNQLQMENKWLRNLVVEKTGDGTSGAPNDGSIRREIDVKTDSPA